MKRGRVTPIQREAIRIFSSNAMPQKSQAQQLHLSTHLVRQVQAEFGMRSHVYGPVPKRLERKILNLFKQGHGEPKICELTGIARKFVRKVISAHPHLRPRQSVGFRYHLSAAKLTAMRRALRESEKRIAEQFGVTRGYVSRFRRQMWNCCGDRHWKRRRKNAASG